MGAHPSQRKKKAKREYTPGFGTGGRPDANDDSFIGVGGFKKKTMTYSGDRRLLGVATMHKSNIVPVFSQEDAESLAHMRR